MAYFKKAIFQRIFFTIGFGFLAAMAFRMLPILINAQRSFGYEHSECTMTKIDWINHGDAQKLVLEYTYNYQGQSYTSRHYMWGLDIFENQKRQGASEFSKRVSVGQRHGCFIDPNNPNNAVINPGSAFKTYELWVMAGFFLLFGWGFLISWVYPKEAEKIFVPADPS